MLAFSCRLLDKPIFCLNHLPGGGTSRTIAARVPVILGDRISNDTFIVLENDVNTLKQSVSGLTSL